MKNIPFVLPVKTALGHYIYEVNKNEILFVDENIFQCVTSEFVVVKKSRHEKYLF